MATMNKVKLFAKQAPAKFGVLVLVALAVVGLATAAIVTYLSNTVTANTIVSSPVELGISTTQGSYGHAPISFSTTGGSHVTLFTQTLNHANNVIVGKWRVAVSSLDGVTCSDLTSFQGTTVTSGGTVGPTEIVPSCVVVDPNQVTYDYGVGASLAVGYSDYAQWDLLFNPLALGDYTFDVTFLP